MRTASVELRAWEDKKAHNESLSRSRNRAITLLKQFISLYGDLPCFILRAPARLNVLGEHVDYVPYLPTSSLPCVSAAHDMWMVVGVTGERVVRCATTYGGLEPCEFEVPDIPAAIQKNRSADALWLDFLTRIPAPPHHWSNYIRGALTHARVTHGEEVTSGFASLIDSTIPLGGGASSSSALTCLSAAAVRIVNGINFSRRELALNAARAEWFIGTRGGALDHLSICFGRTDHLLDISYEDMGITLRSLPSSDYSWMTFFTHPAEKGSSVLLQYNERAAISRIVIPALIAEWKDTQPGLMSIWRRSLGQLRFNPIEAIPFVRDCLFSLPHSLSLNDLSSSHPEIFSQCKDSFPLLVSERLNDQLLVRDRALHHIGEVERVARARAILCRTEDQEQAHRAMVELGSLLNESHASLRDLYGVSTPEVEQLWNLLMKQRAVLGARIMGGGFGGNILALVKTEDAVDVRQIIEQKHYAERGRNTQHDIGTTKPGDGLSMVTGLDVIQEIRDVNRRYGHISQSRSPFSVVQDNKQLLFPDSDELFQAIEADRRFITYMLDAKLDESTVPEFQPIIVAAGSGNRAKDSGLEVPKCVVEIFGKPTVTRVFDQLTSISDSARTPIVVVSPATEESTRRALGDRKYIMVIQEIPLGTGDAVIKTIPALQEYNGLSVVVWGTQPAITTETYRRCIALASLLPKYDMVTPTAFCKGPYAPLTRDESGEVLSSGESHLLGTQKPEFGETNIGMYILQTEPMIQALKDLHTTYFVPSEVRYKIPGSATESRELGFPNSMMDYLAQKQRVFAVPLAHHYEAQGIKVKEDVSKLQGYIAELEKQSGLSFS